MTDQIKPDDLPQNTSLPIAVPPGQHLAAVYCNRFHITVFPDITRIVFGESVAPSTTVTDRGVLVMRTVEAKELADLLLRLIADNDKALQAAMKG